MESRSQCRLCFDVVRNGGIRICNDKGDSRYCADCINRCTNRHASPERMFTGCFSKTPLRSLGVSDDVSIVSNSPISNENSCTIPYAISTTDGSIATLKSPHQPIEDKSHVGEPISRKDEYIKFTKSQGKFVADQEVLPSKIDRDLISLNVRLEKKYNLALGAFMANDRKTALKHVREIDILKNKRAGLGKESAS